MADSDIYGSDPKGLADKVANEALGQLSEAGRKVDINGVRDSRATTNLTKGNGKKK